MFVSHWWVRFADGGGLRRDVALWLGVLGGDGFLDFYGGGSRLRWSCKFGVAMVNWDLSFEDCFVLFFIFSTKKEVGETSVYNAQEKPKEFQIRYGFCYT